MPDYSSAGKTELSDFENQEQFLLHAKGEIVHVLNDLAKKPDIMTGYFDNGRQYILTVVLKVLADRNLLVLDCGPDDQANEALIRAGRLLCITKHNRIHIKFALSGIKRARYQGQPVFAAPLPETVFRLQRREYFRVKTPLLTPVTCEVPWAGNARAELPVLDIGHGGLALLDRERAYSGELFVVLEDCGLYLPDFGELRLDLEVRNIVPQQHKGGKGTQRLGCAFRQLPMNKSAAIQRYIHQLQIAQKSRTD